MTRRTEFYITSIIGIALLVGTIGALLVDAADARPRDAADPAGDLPLVSSGFSSASPS